MKTIPLFGLSIKDEYNEECSYKVSINVSISQGKGANKQTNKATSTIIISAGDIDNFIDQFNEFIKKFARNASSEKAIVE